VSSYTDNYEWKNHTLISHIAIYLGMTLDAKLSGKVRVQTKREELGLRYKNRLAHGMEIGPVNT
jgi:hypothetical protein